VLAQAQNVLVVVLAGQVAQVQLPQAAQAAEVLVVTAPQAVQVVL
jgi:hypothetical protein